MPTIPASTTPFYEKALILYHNEQNQQYKKCCTVDTALNNQLLTAFEYTYRLPLKKSFTGYSGANTPSLLRHLYGNYARILATDFTDNENNLRELCNPDEPLKSLYTRLNECIDYATVAGEPIT